MWPLCRYETWEGDSDDALTINCSNFLSWLESRRRGMLSCPANQGKSSLILLCDSDIAWKAPERGGRGGRKWIALFPGRCWWKLVAWLLLQSLGTCISLFVLAVQPSRGGKKKRAVSIHHRLHWLVRRCIASSLQSNIWAGLLICYDPDEWDSCTQPLSKHSVQSQAESAPGASPGIGFQGQLSIPKQLKERWTFS